MARRACARPRRPAPRLPALDLPRSAADLPLLPDLQHLRDRGAAGARAPAGHLARAPAVAPVPPVAPWRNRPGAGAPPPPGPDPPGGTSAVLNFIYYPVSFILWVWHKAFSFLFGDAGWGGGIAWMLSVMFLVFTLRLILFKPFVAQVRSMRKMQEFQPEMAKIRKKYSNDRQKQAEEMQKLQKEHGVNPVAGCLPVLVQVPVFIGLFHVLREFGPILPNGAPRTENYFFDAQGVQSFNDASFFGAKLGAWIVNPKPPLEV